MHSLCPAYEGRNGPFIVDSFPFRVRSRPQPQRHIEGRHDTLGWSCRLGRRLQEGPQPQPQGRPSLKVTLMNFFSVARTKSTTQTGLSLSLSLCLKHLHMQKCIYRIRFYNGNEPISYRRQDKEHKTKRKKKPDIISSSLRIIQVRKYNCMSRSSSRSSSSIS